MQAVALEHQQLVARGKRHSPPAPLVSRERRLGGAPACRRSPWNTSSWLRVGNATAHQLHSSHGRDGWEAHLHAGGRPGTPAAGCAWETPQPRARAAREPARRGGSAGRASGRTPLCRRLCRLGRRQTTRSGAASPTCRPQGSAGRGGVGGKRERETVSSGGAVPHPLPLPS
jgi:hypothetical protein